MKNRHISSHKIVCWRIYKWCNRSCEFCLSGSSPMQSKHKIDYSLILERIKSLGAEKVTYSGGEPFMHPEIDNIILKSDMLGIEQVMTTNGDYILNRRKDVLSKLTYVKISFYGNEKVHDIIMGIGHYAKLLKSCSYLIKSGVQVGANYVLSAFSFSCVSEFIRDIYHVGVSQCLILTYISTGICDIDRKYQINENVLVPKVVNELSSLKYSLPNGIKVHDYSKRNYFIVISEDLRVTLPIGRDMDWSMGSLFDDLLVMPDGRILESSNAFAEIWDERLTTDAIFVI